MVFIMENRFIGIDIVRSAAVLFTLSVHFFLLNGFYAVPVSGGTMFTMTIMRWFFFTCVPLFMIITGYLQSKKELNLSFFKGIVHIITSYLFICIFAIVFKYFYYGEKLSIIEYIFSITSFKAINYAWYVEMYLGFFMLIPFINILYNNLPSKKWKIYLILIMISITSVSPLLNIFSSKYEYKIISDYWIVMYPFTYYFIGAFIRECQPKINKIIGTLIVIIIVFLEAISSFNHAKGNTFDWSFLGEYNALPTLIVATIIFLILYDIKTIKNKPINFLIRNTSIMSLDIYLVSYIFDTAFYPILNTYALDLMVKKLIFFPVIVFTSFTCSFTFSFLKKLLFDFVKKLN